MLKILGIDPGYGRCGWAIISIAGDCLTPDDFGVVETPAKMPFPQRLEMLYQELTAVIQQHAPAEGALERLFFSRNTKTAIEVGHARGVALLACAHAGLVIGEYKPAEIKLAITGSGAADKTQVQRMVQLLLKMQVAPQMDDAADALAVAICHANARRFAMAVADRRQGGPVD